MTSHIAQSEARDIFEVQAPAPAALMWHRACRHPGLIFGAIVVIAAIVAAVFAPHIAPFDPLDQDISRRLITPVWSEGGNWTYVLGTDAYGRDYLSRLIWGARISLLIGFSASFVAAIVGSILGMAGGYFGGRVDAVIMYLINCKLALPGLIVTLALVSIFGSSVTVLIAVLGFLFWDRYAIVTRTAAMQIRAREFVAAAEAVGASSSRIIFTEILPNLFNNIIVILTLEVAVAILIEATLSFLGLGVPPPTPSWGQMAAEGRAFMFFHPYLVIIPGAAILVLTMAINMMGDGIRDVVSPEGRN